MILDSVKIRKAKLSDNRIIFVIRNQKTSLKYFKLVKYNEHKTWFIENFKSKKNIFYVASIRNRVIGFVKFKHSNKNVSDLSYHVTENLQGRGYGTKILKQSVTKFFQQNREKKKITAKVFKKNVASIKCFIKARFEKKKVDKFIYYEFKKTNLNKQTISLFISGLSGLELLNNYKKQKLRAHSIVIDKQSSKSFIEKVKKTNVAKKVFISGNNISKKILDHLKNDITIIYFFFWPYILKPKTLELIDYVINGHTSYLPYDRGVHPYVYSILRNHPKGVTINLLNNKNIDGGKILKRKKIKYKDFVTGSQLELILKKELVVLFNKNFKYLSKVNLNKIKTKEIDTKRHKLNLRKNLDANTLIKLNKKYYAKDLLKIMISRSGFSKGGAHFVFKKKRYEIDIKIREK